MQNSPNTSQVPYDKDLELKAYIYQQLIEVQPYLVADAQVAVIVEQVKASKKKKEFVVTLSTTIEEGRMETEGQDADIYQAFGKAKDLMVHQLAEIQNSMMDAAEREVEVRTALSGGFTIH